MANYDEMTVKQLKELAKEKGLVGYSKKPKPVLIEMLQQHDSANSDNEIDLESDGFENVVDTGLIRPVIKITYHGRSDTVEGPLSVRDIRRRCRIPNIDTNAIPYVKGSDVEGEVSEDFLVENGMEIEFIKAAPAKG